jgi:hypothetical protein
VAALFKALNDLQSLEIGFASTNPAHAVDIYMPTYLPVLCYPGQLDGMRWADPLPRILIRYLNDSFVVFSLRVYVNACIFLFIPECLMCQPSK